MRVLLVSFHYPPDAAVGSVRAERVADALRTAGHEVEVVAARNPQTGTAPAANGLVRVHRVMRLPNAREVTLELRRLFSRHRAEVSADGHKRGWAPSANIPRWKRFLVAMALLPDDHQGFIIPACLRALRLMTRGFDVLYTSGPPHSAHVVGLTLKLLTGVRWAAEFRDPWTDNPVQARYAVSETASRVKRWLERRTLASADHVITVSDAVATLFADRTASESNAGHGRLVVVRNGVPHLTLPPRPQPREQLRIMHLGTLYHGRDPKPFLQALASLRAAGHSVATRATVDFYGECRFIRGISVQSIIEELDLEGVVRLNESVPRHRVPSMMADADLLLLLAQQQPLQVPAKLYEYLAARRPILAFADPEGETATMLSRVGGHCLVTSSETAVIKDLVGSALASALHGDVNMNEVVLAEWAADREMARLVQVLAP